MQAKVQVSTRHGPTGTTLTKEDVQEGKYVFPYHHLPQEGDPGSDKRHRFS